MGRVDAVCISEKKGTQKQDVGRAEFVADWGIRGDAHAGKWHRQVSLLSLDRVEEFRARGAQVEAGAFGENLLVAGKGVSTDRDAYLRYLHQTMVTGQAAGVAAALCARDGVSSRELEKDVSELQKILKEQGAILDGTT